MKVLVLDDHTGFRNEVVSLLEQNGHEADGVETALAAIPMVESGIYDFVLVDYNMPVHDGIWFMKNVQKPHHTKVLMMTAQTNIYIALSMIRAGGDGYIIKPFSEESLLHHLKFYSQDTELMLMSAGAHYPVAAGDFDPAEI
jgi:two-component system chemotaxis response regulator CheY